MGELGQSPETAESECGGIKMTNAELTDLKYEHEKFERDQERRGEWMDRHQDDAEGEA